MSDFKDLLTKNESASTILSPRIGDSMTGRGNVLIKKIRKSDGQVVESLENHNLIVKVGRSELIKFIGGQSTKAITKMAIGKGGANIETSPFVPIAPLDGDTALYDQVGILNISSQEIDLVSTNPSIAFTALFDSLTIDSLVNEIGLFFNDSATMFARHTFKTVSLEIDDDFALQAIWTIEF